MADNQSAGEKTEQATPRRKLEARKKGTVAKSQDLTGALTLLTVALVAPSAFAGLSERLLAGVGGSLYRLPQQISYGSLAQYCTNVLVPGMAAIGPLIAALMAVGLASNFAQVGFVVSGEALSPTLSKLNPMPGLKRMFSVRSAFDGLKATGKMFLFAFMAFSAIRGEWDKITNLGWQSPQMAAIQIGGITHTILLRVALLWLAIAIVDYMFQRKQVDKQLMMTKDELRREMREQEGSPEVKGAQMRRRRQIAKGGLASKLKQADVVVTNPTHFAVAIAYDRSKMHAPMVVAKGQDYLALRIREFAKDLNVPLVENKPLARALYKQCEAGDYVPRDLFAPVAEVLAYVYQTLKRVKRNAA
ncbi:MAG: EscU/YscU/HrcU family type III secretion system export apparatus switch protein [Armatimonadetes bacterium]|nr:EscU/YscU/HrcU family type III secretion system export apparatus switch protein [Armatimonadota bacterium]